MRYFLYYIMKGKWKKLNIDHYQQQRTPLPRLSDLPLSERQPLAEQIIDFIREELCNSLFFGKQHTEAFGDQTVHIDPLRPGDFRQIG